MISGQRLDAANVKLLALKEYVKLKDIELITKRNELGKPKICSNPTYYKYINGNGTNEDLADTLVRELTRVLKSRGVDVDFLINN
jgi:hypothetical protein